MTDKELILKAQSGDKSANEILAKKYIELVKTIANTFNNIPYKDELISNGSMGLIKAISSYDVNKNTATFKTYAATCIKNAILDGLKKEKPVVALDDQDSQSQMMIEDDQDSELAKILYKRVCDKLSPIEKNVFDLHLKQISYAEIAQELNITKKDVDNKIQAIRKKLDKIVEALKQEF